MNRKQIKKINKLVDVILIDWLRTIVPEEDQEKITKDNFESMLPEAPYFSAKKSRRVSFFTQRWAKQKIKKMYKSGTPLKNIKDIAWLQESSPA